ncbi:MAG: hypothetical protein ACRC8A_09245 [Microcoleaceae cyanobacterium]
MKIFDLSDDWRDEFAPQPPILGEPVTWAEFESILQALGGTCGR